MGAKLRAVLTAFLIAIAFLTITPSLTAQASVYTSPGNQALNWAESHATGHPYMFGGTGPYAYDCSGLVYEAFLHAGINISRDTYTQLTSWGSGHFHLVPWGKEQRGDIAFYGTGHEELVTAWHDQTFGAQQPGTLIGWHVWSGWWQPTMFVRVY